MSIPFSLLLRLSLVRYRQQLLRLGSSWALESSTFQLLYNLLVIMRYFYMLQKKSLNLLKSGVQLLYICLFLYNNILTYSSGICYDYSGRSGIFILQFCGFFSKSSIFRRKFHGILPELREMTENYWKFVNFAEKCRNISGEKGKRRVWGKGKSKSNAGKRENAELQIWNGRPDLDGIQSFEYWK